MLTYSPGQRFAFRMLAGGVAVASMLVAAIMMVAETPRLARPVSRPIVAVTRPSARVRSESGEVPTANGKLEDPEAQRRARLLTAMVVQGIAGHAFGSLSK